MGNIKFKLMLKEVSFEFDGDRDSGSQILNSLSKNLDSISELQNKIVNMDGMNTSATAKRLLGSGNISSANKRPRKPATATVASAPTTRRRRTRRSSTGVSVAQHISKLIDDNFFSTHRSLGDIKSALAKNGIKVEQHQISSPLLYMTKRGVISRSNSTGKWLYFAGAGAGNTRPIRVIKKAAS